MTGLEIEVDVPMPSSDVVAADGVVGLLQYAWRCSLQNRETLALHKSEDGIEVRHGWQPQLPVYTVEWDQIVPHATFTSFLDMNMRSMAEQAAEWDTTFLGAEYLADHGSPEDLLHFARLVRWRFRAAPLQDREMLYMVVPYRGAASGGATVPDASRSDQATMLCYISVKGPRFPIPPGHSRARNLVPSFDLCEVPTVQPGTTSTVTADAGSSDGNGGGTGRTSQGGLRVQHCMTTDIGGGVPTWVWNRVFKSAVLTQNGVEAAHVRGVLQAKSAATATATDTSFGAAAAAGQKDGGAAANLQEDGGGNGPLRRRVVIIGFGDSGVTTAVHLVGQVGDHVDIVGISPLKGHVSGQELGGRLAQPSVWKQIYLLPFGAYRMLDRVRVVHGLASKIDAEKKVVTVESPSGEMSEERYDVLLIASGCSNGFWKPPPRFCGVADVEAELQAEQATLSRAKTIAVVGGGGSGTSAAYNLARRHPTKAVHLFIRGDRILPGYHPSTAQRHHSRLVSAGVQIHSGHSAKIPSGAAPSSLGEGLLSWTSGQPDFECDVVLWAVGAVTPNNSFVPKDMLTADGFVQTDPYLRVRGYESVFAVGDIAATDPGRTSARNDGWALVGKNMQATLSGQPERMQAYQPPAYRWGSILGPWDGDGYEVHFQNGLVFWVPLRVWNWLWPLVQRFLFAGMRNHVDWTPAEQ